MVVEATIGAEAERMLVEVGEVDVVEGVPVEAANKTRRVTNADSQAILQTTAQIDSMIRTGIQFQ